MPHHNVQVITILSLQVEQGLPGLRADSPGQDWYESRNDVPTLLTLDESTIGTNDGKKAALLNDGIAENAYLTQEFSEPDGIFNISLDIYIDSITDSTTYDRSGLIYVGNDVSATNPPAGTSNERFVFMGFYDATPTTDGDMEIRARTSSAQAYGTTSAWTSVATGLSYDTWYNLVLSIDNANDNYDVYVDGTLAATDVGKYSGFPGTGELTHLSISADSDGMGNFYVDNIY